MHVTGFQCFGYALHFSTFKCIGTGIAVEALILGVGIFVTAKSTINITHLAMHTVLNSYTFDYGFTAFFQLQDCWFPFEKLLEMNLCQIICEIDSLNKHLEPFNAFPLNSFWLNIVSCTNFVNTISEIDTLKIDYS